MFARVRLRIFSSFMLTKEEVEFFCFYPYVTASKVPRGGVSWEHELAPSLYTKRCTFTTAWLKDSRL